MEVTKSDSTKPRSKSSYINESIKKSRFKILLILFFLLVFVFFVATSGDNRIDDAKFNDGKSVSESVLLTEKQSQSTQTPQSLQPSELPQSDTNDVILPELEIVKAKLTKVVSTNSQILAGTEVRQELRTIEVKVLEGSLENQTVVIENDHLKSKVGDTIYIQATKQIDGTYILTSYDVYRVHWLIFYFVLFIVLTIWFGGMQGIRGLLSLFASVFVIFYIFLPELLAGGSPIVVSSVVASIIIILGSYVTHGFNRTTSAAVVGMLVTVLVTILLSLHSVAVMRFTGMSSDEAVYLTFNTQGLLDLKGLLLGGIIIGLLGILYDVAIGQAIIVEELLRSAPHLSVKKIFERAIRIGREHIGALVNNLALAYVGVSLPLLLLFYTSSASGPRAIMNREDIATEIARTLIGSIGLVLAVPITTFISIVLLRGKVKFHSEEGAISPSHNSHSHSRIHSHTDSHSNLN